MRLLTRLPHRITTTVLAALIAVAMAALIGLYVVRSLEAASVVMVGAGDIARCTGSGDEATARLLDGISGTVFTVGDNAYHSGTATEFNNCYGPSWGRHKTRTKPAPGNHEYLTAGASGYFGYFGAAAGAPSKGYYSYNRGSWHVVALNSMCGKVGGCGARSPMVTWLKKDLAANPKKCTLAYFHHPLFSSGKHGNQTKMRPTWGALYAANADVVVNGHDHSYERFAPPKTRRHPGRKPGHQGVRGWHRGRIALRVCHHQAQQPGTQRHHARGAETHPQPDELRLEIRPRGR